ncbi:MAG: hypothetical protein AABZ34_04330 [Nitrospirota bacterium]
MYIYDRRLLRSPAQSKQQPITPLPVHGNAYYPDQVVGEFFGRGWTDHGYAWVHEGLGQSITDELSKKLKHLSFLSHFVERNGKDVWLKPSVMDPGIYDGPKRYRLPIGGTLQGFLEGVLIRNKQFDHIKVALVDLTKDICKPEFAGFNHEAPVSAASVPKIAAMLAAYQLRHDLRALLKKQHKGARDTKELFKLVRQDWADTQHDHGGRSAVFTSGVSLRGKLVLVNGSKVSISEPKAPRLEDVFADVKGVPIKIKFKSTGENKARLEIIIDEFNRTKEKKELKLAENELAKAKDELTRKAAQRKLAEAKTKLAVAIRTKRPEARRKLDALGFLERMRVMIGGLTPASNHATSTIVRDVGFLYIASTLLQSGLYDTNRKGGLWLGGDYGNIGWRVGLSGEKDFATATAGSLAAFLSLLVQDKLVSPSAGSGMRRLMQIEPLNPTHPTTQSIFEVGLSAHRLKKVLAKIGFIKNGFSHECAYIERDVVCGKDKKWTLPHRYIAVCLGAKSKRELKQLIDELDTCILANNRTTPCVEASRRA